MEPFQLALVALARDQQSAADAIVAASATVADAGLRIYGSKWPAALVQLREMCKRDIPNAQCKICDFLEQLIELDLRTISLCTIAQLMLDPNVYLAAATGMSKSFSDERRALLRSATGAMAELRLRMQLVLSLAAGAGSEFASAVPTGVSAPVVDSATHARLGEIGTEFYMGVLICATELAHPGAAAALAAAPGWALGLIPDTPRDAETASAALASYHPLQSLSSKIGGPILASVDSAICLQLPQVQTAIEYNIQPLIHRPTAQLSGPLAMMTAGLTPRLIERLRTIRAVQSEKSCGDVQLPALVPARTRVGVTVDGVHVRGLAAAQAPSAPFAGARPTQLMHSARVAAAILDKAVAESSWMRGRTPLVEFERAVMDTPGTPAGDAVVSAVAAEFEALFDRSDPPKTARDFSDLAIGPAAAEPDGYICRALMRLQSEALASGFRKWLAKPLAGRVPMAALERESHITALVQSADNARVIQRRIADEFAASGVATLAMERAAEKPLALRSLLTGAVRAATAAALGTAPIFVSPPTLKLYAATY